MSKCQTHFGRQKFPLINNIFKIYYLLELKMTLSQQFDTLTLWHPVVSLLMLFPQNIVFGNNLYAFWQNQHKLPYRCSGYLQLPRSFGVRKKNRDANWQSRLRIRIQDFYQILQKGVKARRFHTLFFIIHHSATIVIYSSNYCVNGEFQRKTEKNREI